MPHVNTFHLGQSNFSCTPDGAARIGATLFSELLNAVFASIGQRAVRKVARETFEHLLNLDLKFHLSRQTGGLTRAIDRGTKCIKPPTSQIVLLTSPQGHHVCPAVCIIQDRPDRARGFVGLWDTGTLSPNNHRVSPLTCFLARTDVQVWMGLRCNHGLDDVRVCLVHSSHHCKEVNTAAALPYTCLLTPSANPRIQYRRAVNQADNKAATVSIDSLINYEAVKVCHSPPPVRQYISIHQNPLSTSITKSTRLSSMISILPHTRNLRSRLPHRSLS